MRRKVDVDKATPVTDRDLIDTEVTPTREPPPQNNFEERNVSGKRKKGRRNTQGPLSSHPEDALVKAGEDKKRLQRMNRELDKELKPSGRFGEILFDRLWFSFLKNALIARMESGLSARIKS